MLSKMFSGAPVTQCTLIVKKVKRIGDGVDGGTATNSEMFSTWSIRELDL